MKKAWILVALGVLSYLAFALATLPATVITSRLPPAIAMAGVEGSAWNGRAAVVSIGGTQLGALNWNLHALSLLAAKAKADIKLTRSDGFVQATIAMRNPKRVSVSGLTGSLPLDTLPPSAAPGGWKGTLNMRLASLELVDGWPARADGTIELINLVGPARRPAELGSYKVIFPPELTGNELVGALADTGGPLEIAGNIRLKPDRSYLVEGSVAARPEAPRSMTDGLQMLGSPDAQGRRPFSLAGTM